MALDFETEQDGVPLTTSTRQHELWQNSWLFKWLHDHAVEHHFKQLDTEEWHYDHQTVDRAPTGTPTRRAPRPRREPARRPRPRRHGRCTAARRAGLAAARAQARACRRDDRDLLGAARGQEVVAASSLEVLRDVLRAAGLSKAEITSTARTAEDQARAMYENLVGKGKGQGVKAQYDLYGPTGDKVVDSFVELSKKGLSAADIKEGMRKKIEELGPANVSRHCADPKKLNVFDVAPSSIGDAKAQEAFIKAAEAGSGSASSSRTRTTRATTSRSQCSRSVTAERFIPGRRFVG